MADESHVLETEQVVIKDEIIDSVDLSHVKTEPEDILEYETIQPYESYDPVAVETTICKPEKEADVQCTDDVTVSENVTPSAEGTLENEPSRPVISLNASNSSNPETHCHICNKEFRRHSALIGHLKSHFEEEDEDDDDSELECDVCQKTFKTKYSLEKHAETHYKIHKCDNCEFITNSSLEKYMHNQICRKIETLYKCRECKFETKNENVRNAHVKMHKMQKNRSVVYKCRVCNFETRSISLKIDHLKIHGEYSRSNLIFKCRKCSFETQNENARDGHVQSFHSSEEDVPYLEFQCGVCSDKFSDVESFSDHKKTHSSIECKECNEILASKSYTLFHRLSQDCSKCGSKFSMHSPFDLHVNFHKENMNCKCEVCGQEFVRPSEMFIHQKERHARRHRELSSQVANIKRRIGGQIHLCKRCGKKCIGVVNYTKHLLSHWQRTDNIMKCRICGANFKSMFELMSHKKANSCNSISRLVQ